VQDRDLLNLSETDRVAIAQLQLRRRDAAAARHGGLGAGERAQAAGRGDVVGVGVGLEDVGQAQAEALEVGEVALPVLVDRVDDRGVIVVRAGDDVGEGRRDGVEQLDRITSRRSMRLPSMSTISKPAVP
jgi:hypothetical protein